MKFYILATNGATLAGILRVQNAVTMALKGRLPPAIDRDWKLVVIIAIASVLVATYLITSLQSWIALRSHKRHPKRPPILPYWIPFVGHVFSCLRDGPRLAAKIV